MPQHFGNIGHIHAHRDALYMDFCTAPIKMVQIALARSREGEDMGPLYINNHWHYLIKVFD